jgi:hypothetical protein
MHKNKKISIIHRLGNKRFVDKMVTKRFSINKSVYETFRDVVERRGTSVNNRLQTLIIDDLEKITNLDNISNAIKALKKRKPELF